MFSPVARHVWTDTCRYDQAATCASHLPVYLAETEFAEPTGGFFKNAFCTDIDLFPWLMAHPKPLSNFNDCMVEQRLHRVDWFNFTPVEDVLIERYKGGNAPLLVDIGGNRGYDLDGLKRKYPAVNGQGKLILQDLPQVIEDIGDLDEETVRMAFDFHTRQPVRGMFPLRAPI